MFGCYHTSSCGISDSVKYGNFPKLILQNFIYFFSDAARELEEGERKKKPNCFALGPMFDNFAKRTYYISCGMHQLKGLSLIF